MRIRGSEFIRQMKDIVELGIRRYSEVYQKEMDDLGLSLYQKYSRKDICRLLNWEKDESSTVYGYKIKYDTCPIFVTYHKKEDIAKSTMYEDEFVNNRSKNYNQLVLFLQSFLDIHSVLLHQSLY